MSTEALKEQARRHEQREEWSKALDAYSKVIARQQGSEDQDIALYNRVGDLHIRMQNVPEAVASYETAIDLYLEAELPNNAVAICRKIIRNDPNRAEAFLRLGRLRADQGFVVDARESFLTYAELMQGRGKSDEAFGALEEFAGRVPQDVETRLFVAEQLVTRGREAEALEHFSAAYAVLAGKGEDEQAATVLERIHGIDPDHPVPDPVTVGPSDGAEGDGGLLGFESTALDGPQLPDAEEVPAELPSEADDDDEISFSDIALGEEEASEASDTDEEGVDEPAFEPLSTLDDDGETPELSASDSGAFDLELTEEDAADEEEPAAIDGLESVPEDFDPLPTLEGDDEDSEVDFSLDEAGESDAPDGEEEPLPALDLEAMSEEGPSEALSDEVTLDETAPDDTPSDDAAVLGEADLDFGDLDFESDLDVDEDEADRDEGAAEPVPAVDAPDDDAPADDASEEDSAADDPLPTLELEGPDEPDETVGGPAPAEPGAAPDTRDEAALRARVEVDASDGEGWYRLGEALLLKGDRTEANRAFERAHPLLAAQDRHREAIDVVRHLLQTYPDRVDLHRRAVEYAHETDERPLLIAAFLELAETLFRTGERAKADAVFERVLALEPGNARARRMLGRVATPGGAAGPSGIENEDDDDEYVDLGSLVMEEEEESSTRWVVVADAPTGDEEADFARMLSQFKEKVSKNLPTDDQEAHYDLGTAYKEMGLLEEAIGEFQLALKARPDHLPTIEVLGSCFLEKGEPRAAARTLERGLDFPVEVEDDLLGVYYFLGRAYERIGNTDSAKEFYEKIFALDINFEDVTERLRTLR